MHVAFAFLRKGPIEVNGHSRERSERAEWRRPPGASGRFMSAIGGYVEL